MRFAKIFAVLLLTSTLALAKNAKIGKDLDGVNPLQIVKVIVQFKTHPNATDLKNMGPFGQVMKNFSHVNGMVIPVPAALLDSLSNIPNVKFVTLDRPLKGRKRRPAARTLRFNQRRSLQGDHPVVEHPPHSRSLSPESPTGTERSAIPDRSWHAVPDRQLPEASPEIYRGRCWHSGHDLPGPAPNVCNRVSAPWIAERCAGTTAALKAGNDRLVHARHPRKRTLRRGADGRGNLRGHRRERPA